MVIYADILFLTNLYIDALLLALTRRFLHLPLSARRWAVSSALGGLLSFSALLPRLPPAGTVLLGLAETALLALAAFAPKPPKTLLKAAFSLFLFAAALSGLLLLLPVGGLTLQNGAVYFPLSAPLLLAMTCLAYGALRLFSRLSGAREPDALLVPVEIALGGRRVRLTAKADTGLSLVEPFSGEPVLVAERAALGDLLPPGFPALSGMDAAGAKLRLVPFSSLGADGVLPAFRPDRLAVRGEEAAGWVAVTDRPLSSGAFSALLHPALLEPAPNPTDPKGEPL